MLNLSDKELDRLSKEAAQEYEPGEILGQDSWERLEMRLDRDLGHLNPNPLRHIRRYPFYYAPALLVLIGVSYYFMRQGTKGSGSPPVPGISTPAAAVRNIPSSKNPVYPDTLTSTPAASADVPASPTTADGKAGGTAGAPSAIKDASEGAKTPAGAKNISSGVKNNSSATLNNSSAALNNSGRSMNGSSRARLRSQQLAAAFAGSSGRRTNNHGGRRSNIATASDGSGNALTMNGQSGTPASGQSATPQRELTRSTIQGLHPIKKAPYIDDSALRHFTLKGPLARNKGVHINRSLQFGVLVAPDFASVNALSGDKAGSTIGLTVDYQFANKWYIGTGLLVDRKNYAARPQDFHQPVGNWPGALPSRIQDHMEFVKGSFGMLEIPLNLRYDFSVTGSTLFFASGGISSYLFTNENNGVYYSNYGPQSCYSQQNPTTSNYLFSSIHFSLGVETGLSNSLSLLIAPYAELPVRGIGMGQVQMSSVGINFSLKFAPVISRKRY